MDQPYNNIGHAWSSLLESNPDGDYLKLEGSESARGLSYTFSRFFKRAARIANVWIDELGLQEGDRIAVLTDDPNDMALLLQSVWIAGLVAVPIAPDVSTEVINDLVRGGTISVVIFPPAASARLANLDINLERVPNWLVTGSAMHFDRIPGIKRLDELVLAASPQRDVESLNDLGDRAALFIPSAVECETRERASVSYSAADLCGAGWAAACQYPDSSGVPSLCWTSRSHMKLEGMVNALLAPMYTGMPYLLREFDDYRKFWAQMRSDSITSAWITQDELRQIYRRGKPTGWVKPDNLTLLVSCASRFSYELLEQFEERFLTEVLPIYCNPGAGGAITAWPFDGSLSWRHEYGIPAAGMRIDGVDIKIVDHRGEQLGPEESGEITIKTPWMGQRSDTGAHSDHFVDTAGYYHTADEGFIVEAGDDLQILFASGAREDFIERDGELVNLARITNEILLIRGVGYGVAVGFPNFVTGLEVGCFVIPMTAAHLSEDDMAARLRRGLDWFECPKAIIIGEKSEANSIPTLDNVVSRFEEFYYTDFRWEPA